MTQIPRCNPNPCQQCNLSGRVSPSCIGRPSAHCYNLCNWICESLTLNCTRRHSEFISSSCIVRTTWSDLSSNSLPTSCAKLPRITMLPTNSIYSLSVQNDSWLSTPHCGILWRYPHLTEALCHYTTIMEYMCSLETGILKRNKGRLYLQRRCVYYYDR